MTRSQLPRAATWLLKSLTPRGKSEVLLGDLEEDFVQGRSAAWYWRQVLATILVSLAQELRCRWMAIGFTALWAAAVVLSILLYFYTSSHTRPLFDAVYGRALGFTFPISVIFVATFTLSLLSALETMAGLSGLGIYLLATRNFTLRGFLHSASVVLAIVFVGNVVIAAILLVVVPAHLSRVVIYLLESTLVFVSLLVAVWTPSVENTRAKSISA
jgi:hypothetical protein